MFAVRIENAEFSGTSALGKFFLAARLTQADFSGSKTGGARAKCFSVTIGGLRHDTSQKCPVREYTNRHRAADAAPPINGRTTDGHA